MLYFTCDYQEGCIPEILSRMNETNLEQTEGYGVDAHCERARALIREACGAPDARVHFLIGGTQVNSVTLHGLLGPVEGAISADTGHINGHEGGAVEARGHKVLVIPGKEGKLSSGAVAGFMTAFNEDGARDHVVQPGLVYISHPTEFGTLYSLSELEAIRRECDRFGLRLFVDGARLGYALASEGTDVTLPDLARLTDAFYIGGTKCGALLGEALVIGNPRVLPKFFTFMKQQGAVLAKGRVLGIQFETLFENGNYVRVCRNAVRLAQKIKRALLEKGYALHVDTPTNQIFPVLTPEKYEALRREVLFERWCVREDGGWVCRFATSWATREEDADRLIALL